MNDCGYDTQPSSSVSNRKQAVIASTFLIFILYEVSVGFAYIRKDTEIGKRLKRFMNDMAYRDLFYFLTITILEIAVPKPFPIVMAYFYFAAVVGHGVLFVLNKPKFLFITYIVKNVLVFIMIMCLLADIWCQFFQYRRNTNQFG